MDFKVRQAGESEYTVRFKESLQLKVITNLGGVQVPAKFEDLADFDPDGLQDSYVIMYDANTQKYKAVNPDLVLSRAISETTSPGIPTAFIDQLDIELDDKIDLDAGTF
jgi:hypothetical protein